MLKNTVDQISCHDHSILTIYLRGNTGLSVCGDINGLLNVSQDNINILNEIINQKLLYFYSLLQELVKSSVLLP